MRAVLQLIYTNPRYTKAIEWGRLIAITGSAQVVIQAISIISGILVVRLLSTEEYAFYTLANTMLGTMTVLSDGGIVNGVMATGGKVWNVPKKLGIVILSGLALRRKFSLVSFLVVAPILVYLLYHHGASILLSFLITLSILPAFLTSIYGTLIQIPVKLHQAVSPLQKIQLENSVIRLAILLVTLFVFPWTSVVLLAAGIPQIWSNRQLKQLANTYTDLSYVPSPLVQKEIMSSVKRILPDAIYYCLSGQLTIWLISIFGETTSVAQIGALGRLNAALTLLTVVFSTLVIPRFARLSSTEYVAKFFNNTLLGLFFICSSVIGICWILSDQLLLILGENYKHLNDELLLCIIGGCLSTAIGIVFNLYTSRGFAIKPSIIISISILTNILAIFFINYSTVYGVLVFNLFVNSIQLCTHLSYGLYKTNISKT